MELLDRIRRMFYPDGLSTFGDVAVDRDIAQHDQEVVDGSGSAQVSA